MYYFELHLCVLGSFQKFNKEGLQGPSDLICFGFATHTDIFPSPHVHLCPEYVCEAQSGGSYCGPKHAIVLPERQHGELPIPPQP